VLELRDGLRKNWQALTTHIDLHKTNTRWLVHSWSTFGARTSHGQLGFTRLIMTRTWGSHHLPPYSILCASPRGPHPNDILSWDSQVGVPKFPNLGLPRFWGPITFCENLWLIWGLMQSCSLCWELSNGMWHATCMQGNRVDSWLLVTRSQTANLTLGPSFDHNLCFRCPNGHVSPFQTSTFQELSNDIRNASIH
jgi:hypothetical protein